jgi:Transketolase, N-terminal subunit
MIYQHWPFQSCHLIYFWMVHRNPTLMANITELENIAAQVRRDIVRMVHGARTGHPGGSLGCTDFFTALYLKS